MCSPRSLALALALLLACGEASAARLFTSGFETNNFNTTEWNVTAGTAPTFQGVTVHSGSYSAQGNVTAGFGTVYRTLASAITTGTIYVRGYWRWGTLPAASVARPIIQALNTSAGSSWNVSVIAVTGSKYLRLTNSVSTTTQTCGNALATGQWYRIEVKHVPADSGGSIQLKVFSGETTSSTLCDVTISGEDTLNTSVQRFTLGCAGTDTYNEYFDDIAINDATGSFQTSWPGPGKVAMLKPASNSSVAWTKTGANCSGTTNTDCVDDEPGAPDDASGYNDSGATSGAIDRFNTTTLPAEVPSDADMVLVHLIGRWGGNGTTGTRSGRLKLWDEGGNLTDGPTISSATGCDISGWPAAGTVETTAEMLVFDLGSRSKANVDSFDWGSENLTNYSCLVTAIWANVEWTEAVAVTCSQSIALMGVGCR